METVGLASPDSISSKPQTLKDTHEPLWAEAVLTAVPALQKGWRHQNPEAWTLHGLPKAIFKLPAGSHQRSS